MWVARGVLEPWRTLITRASEKENAVTEKRDAVIYLDSDQALVDRAMAALAGAMPEAIMVGLCLNTYVRWAKVFEGVAEANAEVRVLVVDPTPNPKLTFNSANESGRDLLRSLRKKQPRARIFLFDGSLSPAEVQRIMEAGLIHHYESKPQGSLERVEYWRRLAEKIRKIARGEYAGNIQSPDDGASRQFLSCWVHSLPREGETTILDFNGKEMEARQVLDDPETFRQFAQAVASGSFERRIERAKQLAGQKV